MIRQVDEYLDRSLEWKNRLLESHPEVSFQILNGGRGLTNSKKTPEGQTERIRILQDYGINPIPHLSKFSAETQNDFLDALSLAVSAQLGLQNGFVSIPECPKCDHRGLKMQMIFGSCQSKS